MMGYAGSWNMINHLLPDMHPQAIGSIHFLAGHHMIGLIERCEIGKRIIHAIHFGRVGVSLQTQAG